MNLSDKEIREMLHNASTGNIATRIEIEVEVLLQIRHLLIEIREDIRGLYEFEIYLYLKTGKNK